MPYKFDYKISYVYNEFENSNPYKTDDIMAIDLGVNNLATIITRYSRRDNYIKNFLHKSATQIIDIALTRGIKKIVIGYHNCYIILLHISLIFKIQFNSIYS